MERKGVFTPDLEKFIAEALDNFFKFNNVLIESMDKTIFSILVKSVDNMALDKLQPAWKEMIIPVIDAAMAGDKEKVRELVVVAVNTPLGDEIEYLAYDAFGKFIVTAVAHFIEKKRQA